MTPIERLHAAEQRLRDGIPPVTSEALAEALADWLAEAIRDTEFVEAVLHPTPVPPASDTPRSHQ